MSAYDDPDWEAHARHIVASLIAQAGAFRASELRTLTGDGPTPESIPNLLATIQAEGWITMGMQRYSRGEVEAVWTGVTTA